MQSKSRFLGLTMIGAMLVSVGCSEPEHRRPSKGGSDSSSSSGAGGSSSASGGGGDQGSGGGGQGGAGGQAASGDLLPLTVGYQWEYDVQKLAAEDTCGADTTTTVLDPTTLDGKTGFNVDYFCSSPLVLRSDGDLVEFNQGNGWKTLLAPPVEEGASWTCFDSAVCTWKSAGTVTVPAGTFSNCWTATVDFMDGGLRERTYCRGVGHVTSYTEALGGDGYDAKLLKKASEPVLS